MIPIVHDVYEVNLATSGKLKLRAKGLLAEGTPDAVFEACVLLHEAARLQQLAVDSLPTRPAVTSLTSAVEECWCYVEGRDPPHAAEAWGHVLRAREGVEDRTSEAILSRLAPRFAASRHEFGRAVSASPMLLAIRDAGHIASLMPAERSKARGELAQVLAKFPGTTSFWWMQYRLAEADGNKKEAWEALTRARLLVPTNPRFLAMSLLVAAWALPPSAAEQHIAGVRGSIDRAGAEVCLMYALAEVALARKASPDERRRRWRRAREASDSGIARANTEGLRRNLRAAQLLANELLAGRQPTMEILYLAGLGEVAAMASPNANVADFLTARLRRAGPDREREAA
ncbi:MAG: hypothetical protein HYZ29_34470 [Myxococcales bacterium]|nr:hypothetical protein [Myxococcales bacterium]